jgi:ferric-dicitrate binding protein FerR (iron transport regulator)
MNGPTIDSGEMLPELESALRASLRAEVLGADAWLRIRRATEAEWQRNVRPASRRPPLAVAASIFALAACLVALWSMGARGERGALMAHLDRAEDPGVIKVRQWRADRPLHAGSELRVGQTFEARGVSLVTLIEGGDLRFAPGSQFEIETASQVRLERGEMYVDIPPHTHTGAAFVVRTPAGEFRHLGTQFALAVIEGTTRLRVREGTVQWRGANGDSTVPAGTEIVINHDRKTARRQISTSGREFAWTETVTPDVDIDNRPLSEFLTWVGRETGRKIVFADEEARRQISMIRMHGDVRGLTTLQALSAVMAATSLRFDLTDGAIRLSYAGAPPPPSR